jgi:diguanylate cyclase (GGDEF)-like protein
MTVSRKFFAGQLAVLAPLVVAVALAGVEGLASVKSDFDRVFTDNITVSHVSTTTAADLARADEIALRLATTTSPAERLSLNATLDQSVVPAVDADLSELQVLHAHDAVAERARVERLVRGWSQFVALRDTGLLGARAIVAPAPNTSNRLAQEISGIFDPLAGITETETALEVSQASQAHARAVQAFDTSRLLIWAIALAAFGLGIGSVLLLTRSIVKRQEVQNEFVDALQVTDSEEVVHDLLKRQVERTIPGSSVVVLNRNNSEDRLEATTPLQDDSLLKQGLASAKPRSCKAVLFARPHAEDPEREPLTRCEVCGKAGRRTTCEPLLVAGEVIGSVLVEHDKPLREQDTTALRESVSQAAPVLANLRNLAVAEFRAATDALTGLPNKRAVQDTIKRMAARAGRTLAPLSAMMVDLDHFKQINDGYGHGRGDDVLAAVGAALSMTVRASDFVGRNGGDEFIVLLPNTDAERAAGVGEKLRAAIAEITVSDVDRDITASVGIATIPQHARDGDQLVRSADRALYVAKTNGRNEVEIAVAAPRNEPEPETGPGLISA